MRRTIEIVINGEPRSVPEEQTIEALVSDLELPNERIAIELNRRIVRKSDWPMTHVTEGDRIEIVHFVGGG